MISAIAAHKIRRQEVFALYQFCILLVKIEKFMVESVFPILFSFRWSLEKKMARV